MWIHFVADDTQVVQQYSLAGSCLDLGFQVEFQLSEAQVTIVVWIFLKMKRHSFER